MHKPLLRSTPFRIAMILGLVLVASLAIAALISFLLIRNDLMNRVDRDLEDTYAVIEQSFDGSDIPDLVDLVANHVRATVRSAEVYLLRSPDGRVLAGNLNNPLIGKGFQSVSATALGVPAEGPYRILQGSIDGYQLLVGKSLAEADEITRLILTILGCTSALLAAGAMALGAVLAVSAQRRLDQIAGTMEKIGRGDLSARIPVSGRNDDIDALVGHVNEALGRLAALVEGMRQVSVDIAHELRMPLNRLSIILSTAFEAAENRPEQREPIEEAQAEIGNVVAIFDAMLRIAQIEAGARRARFENVALKPLLDTIADAYGPVAAENGQTLELLEGDPGEVRGDRDLLTQLLANLVENAMKHTPEGTRICIAGRFEHGHARIVVSDNGPGIPDADKLRVFDRLYRVEKSRTTPGNGLGLAFVKAIAELHRASLALADNNPGTVVKITFPPLDAPG